ncbi:MAG TPA: alpha/beta hydrolase [Gemmataceae bacterium]|jgi:pimeloyl-ACP methyl ester carboxylesterase
MSRQVVFFGGNGHAAARLAPARAALARAGSPFALREVEYPGFEDRPRAATFDDFLDALIPQVAEADGETLLHGTGIGGLIALCLRARGVAVGVPLLLQAPILWGLERRWFPRLMRLGLAPLIGPVFRRRWFQRRFMRKQFLRPPPPELQAAFFAGYDRCTAAADFFRWLTPALLRRLERAFADRPAARNQVRVWWGRRDAVVSLDELEATPVAMRAGWPVRVFPDWGHYPMVESPEAWVEAVGNELAAVEPVPRRSGAEAE